MTRKRVAHGQGIPRFRSAAGELIETLCQAEALTSRLDPDQSKDLVHARGDLWFSALASRDGASADRKRAVLAHPDLSRRLAQLLGLADPRRWNGYVPPAFDDRGRPNDSPIRAALLKLIHQAYTREHAGEAASA